MPRILVVGSHHADDDARLAFEAICRELGSSLARAGHEVIICSTSGENADPHVVDGAAPGSDMRDRAHITYVVSREELEEFEAGGVAHRYSQEKYPGVVWRIKPTHRGWFATYNAATDICDAVIAVGGTPKGTGAAAYIALAKGKPVLAIPVAGGVARDLWHDFSEEYSTLPDYLHLPLRGADAHAAAESAIAAIEHMLRQNPFPALSNGIRQIVSPLVMLLLAAAWVVGTTEFSDSRWLPYAVALTVAGGGLLFRYATDEARTRRQHRAVERWARDLTRVIGALLGVGLVFKLAATQADLHSASSGTLLAAWLGVIGFASGFLVEHVTESLARTLERLIDTSLGRQAGQSQGTPPDR